MAAHLKKRAYEEYVQSVTQEDRPQPVKLYIHVRQRQDSCTLFLPTLEGSSADQALTTLLDFGSNLTHLSSAQTESVAQSILKQYQQQASTYISVKVKLLQLLSQVALTPGFRVAALAGELLTLLTSTESHRVKVQLLSSLTSLGRSLFDHADIHDKMVEAAKQHLSDLHHTVRCECLSLIGALSTIERVGSKKEEKKYQRLLCTYIDDQDPRVRQSALKAMLTLHQRGQRLDLSIYQQSVKVLSDDFDGVRLAALKLIWVLSHVYPEEMLAVQGSSEDKLRLIDDGFTNICQMVNDQSVNVRSEAVGLLGSLHLVSPKFLQQTLDKKLMSGLRRKRTSHERQKESYASGDWSTGQKWNDDAPKELIDPCNVSLINSGSCGAFVHGLEDEFLEVRSAALDSLCELATHSPSFARLSLDFLVDMFNDEIESVRLNAICSMRKITKHIVLRQDQLEIILNVLDDFSREIREALHELLCTVVLATKSCLSRSLHFLMRNLNKYPQDKSSIWNCLKHLGKSHHDLTLTLVPELLGTHPYFDTPEPDMDDPAYIGVMILILNSAAECPTMVSLFPDYTIRHYSYLRDSLPHLVPYVKYISSRSLESSHGPLSDEQGHSIFLAQTLENVQHLDTMSRQSAVSLMQLIIRDLHRVSAAEPGLSACADFCAQYIQCQLVLNKALSEDRWNIPAPLCPQQSADTMLAAATQILDFSYQLEHLFLGCSKSEQASIIQMRIRGWSLEFLVQLRGKLSNSASKQGATQGTCQQYLNRLGLIKRYFSAAGVKPDTFTHALFSEMNKLDGTKAGILAKLLQPLLLHHSIPSLLPSNKLSKVTAKIQEPAGGSDNPLRFTAGLALAIDVDCMLDNVQDVNRIKIQVKFPDCQVQLFSPKTSDFRSLSPLRHRLQMQVYMSHSMWSDPCQIQVSVVMTYNPDKIGGNPVVRGADRASKQRTLNLCEPVKVFVMPRPAKK
ncbi:integrator complex subunit 4-like [Acanthaster planci]|uniref:Integrator complex subunit 4-like n=1 Tax=Acanthaster planci TaxID=133434 RepID=A0A8B7YXG1_ACAPL|nr:integrator complex subunit 4-like [Acanthaster planci]